MSWEEHKRSRAEMLLEMRTGRRSVQFTLGGMMDFAELQEQKAKLAELAGGEDWAEGLLSFLDFVQDTACHELGTFVVFGRESEG
jgi:hypothetical protein